VMNSKKYLGPVEQIHNCFLNKGLLIITRINKNNNK